MSDNLELLMTASPYSLMFALYGFMSLVTFIAYWKDKVSAIKGTWRVQESTLHWLAFLGGWPGALIAQNRLRHKTKKQPFRQIFWSTVILHCVIVLVLLSPLRPLTLQAIGLA